MQDVDSPKIRQTCGSVGRSRQSVSRFPHHQIGMEIHGGADPYIRPLWDDVPVLLGWNMPIEFTSDRWDKIREDADRWWFGDLKRPLIQMRFQGRDPGRAEPKIPGVPRTAFYLLNMPVSQIVDRWDYDLSRVKYGGDAFPEILPDFGPGAIAAFLGAVTVVEDDTVWFQPMCDARCRRGRIHVRWEQCMVPSRSGSLYSSARALGRSCPDGYDRSRGQSGYFVNVSSRRGASA